MFVGAGGFAAPARAAVARLWKASLGLAVVETSYGALYQVDILMIGVFMTPAAVGLYQAPLRVLTPITYIGVAIAAGLAPMVAREPRSDRRRALVARSLCWLAVAETAIAAVVFARADDIVSLLFGSDFHVSVRVLHLLAPYVFMAAFAPVASLLVTYLGRLRGRLIIGLTALALNLALDLVLIPTFGLTGAAIAADVAALYYVGSHCWLLLRVLGLRPWAFAGMLGRSAAAAATIAAALVLVGRGGDGWEVSAFAVTAGLVLVVYACGVLAPGRLDRIAREDTR
jgi:O-antigen/teichoic acid export membrane protein